MLWIQFIEQFGFDRKRREKKNEGREEKHKEDPNPISSHQYSILVLLFFIPLYTLSISHGGAEWNETFMFGSELEALKISN